MSTEIDVEYCGSCGYLQKYQELSEYLGKRRPDLKVNGQEGRRASFEVKINGQLVHSKLSTLAYPDYDDLITLADEITQGKEIRKCKGQPITNCIIS